MEKLNLGAIGERLKTGGAQMGRAVSGKMKEILSGPTPESKIVDEATSERLEEPNWGLNLRICGMLNSGELSGGELVKGIKKKIGGKSVVSQKLGLELLETCAMNCDKVFSEIASEKVLEEMVKMIDDGKTEGENRRRGFELIRAWGESEDLSYLPVFRQIYMGLKTRGTIPAQDNGTPSFSLLDSDSDQQALYPSENYPIPDTAFHSIPKDTIAYHAGSLSVEEKKKYLVVARNSIEVLSSMLNETEPKVFKDDLTLCLLEECKESQPVLQRIIQNTTDDEGMLFEALNLNDELQQVISKYEEMEAVAQLKGKAPESSDTPSNISPASVDAVHEGKINTPKGESNENGFNDLKSLPIGENTEVGSPLKNQSKSLPIGESTEVGSPMKNLLMGEEDGSGSDKKIGG